MAATSSSSSLTSPALAKLACLVVGDQPDAAFIVDRLAPDSSVSDLRIRIAAAAALPAGTAPAALRLFKFLDGSDLPLFDPRLSPSALSLPMIRSASAPPDASALNAILAPASVAYLGNPLATLASEFPTFFGGSKIGLGEAVVNVLVVVVQRTVDAMQAALPPSYGDVEGLPPAASSSTLQRPTVQTLPPNLDKKANAGFGSSTSSQASPQASPSQPASYVGHSGALFREPTAAATVRHAPTEPIKMTVIRPPADQQLAAPISPPPRGDSYNQVKETGVGGGYHSQWPAQTTPTPLYPGGQQLQQTDGNGYAAVSEGGVYQKKADSGPPPTLFQKYKLFILGGAVLLLVILATVIGVVVGKSSKSNGDSAAASAGATTSSSRTSPTPTKSSATSRSSSTPSPTPVDFTSPFALQYNDHSVCLDMAQAGNLGPCPSSTPEIAAKGSTNTFRRSSTSGYWSMTANSSQCIGEGAAMVQNGVEIIGLGLVNCFAVSASVSSVSKITFTVNSTAASSGDCITAYLAGGAGGLSADFSPCMFPVPLNQTWIAYNV
ncbi:hypothetical protein DFJ73DRAFT_963767 [Zopfochytrium polystomum]|nr:hypothetical protein DFJ73DRAFT_963767 [Zopfochytrium polystomum]